MRMSKTRAGDYEMALKRRFMQKGELKMLVCLLCGMYFSREDAFPFPVLSTVTTLLYFLWWSHRSKKKMCVKTDEIFWCITEHVFVTRYQVEFRSYCNLFSSR